MKYFFTRRVKIVLIITVLLAVILGVLGSFTGLGLPKMVVQGVLTPIRAGVSKLTSSAEDLYDYIFSYESMAAENESLKRKISEMEDAARQKDALSQENQRLRALLDLRTGHYDYKFTDGYIISWDSGDWSNTFTINRGSSSGIEVNMCAVTANGELVGLVSEVGPNYAVIKSVLDSSLEISATISASGYNGMVKGGYTSDLPNMLRMNYLASNATIHINDQVVTTGSTVYPRGLVIGKVVDAGYDDTGVAKYAILEPAVDIQELAQVFIITEYDVE
ncbi:MAG: rod shape-determining protein MreC [Oscillospiraceae bacterium]|nr:rod shape-determining protein MreC [Oscillospiraceae bacterium]